jgi:hypothetical protein
MFKLDFSDINRNGFRINRFRLFHSPELRCQKFTSRREELKISDDLVGERDLLIEYLIEQNEIIYSLYFFSARILVVLIFIAVLTILLYKGALILKLLPIISASVFYFLSIRYKESFVMGNVGIQITECLYNAKIAERYNF